MSRAAVINVIFLDMHRAAQRHEIVLTHMHRAAQRHEFHDVKHALLEFSRTVRTRAGDVVKAGTQVLNRQWRSLKDYLPKTLATKSKAGHVNQSLWQWTYKWQYRYNNGKDLWTAVPHVLKHIRNA